MSQSYLARLKAKIGETHLPDQPSKPSKGTYEGFEGEGGRHALQSVGGHSSARGWWSDASEVLARFDESAAIREFDHGLSRREAEMVAADCIIAELRVMGLDAAEAEAVLANARARQRFTRH